MWLDAFVRDVQYGVRSLLKSPAFSALAIVSLATGIMATTAIYSVLHAVVLDPFPYKDVDRLMSVRVSNPAARGGRTGYSIDQFLEIAERNTHFRRRHRIDHQRRAVDRRGRAAAAPRQSRNVQHVRRDGRAATDRPDADAQTMRRPGAEPVVVLGYRFWQRQFGGDPGVLGRQLRLNDTVRTVIGVMPKRFMWRGADVYLPTQIRARPSRRRRTRPCTCSDG